MVAPGTCLSDGSVTMFLRVPWVLFWANETNEIQRLRTKTVTTLYEILIDAFLCFERHVLEIGILLKPQHTQTAAVSASEDESAAAAGGCARHPDQLIRIRD